MGPSSIAAWIPTNPSEFLSGNGQVIKGWDEGVAGMKVGGKRKLIIPPTLGYGPGGSPGKIPPNATLFFEVELLGTAEPKATPESPITASANTANGLKIEDQKVGDGPGAKQGQTVSVHYTGWLTNGAKFDSSKDAGRPFTFMLGAGRVIKGWDQGVAGMKVGGKRKLTIPPELAYGKGGFGNVIPPDSTLIFEVELLKIED